MTDLKLTIKELIVIKLINSLGSSFATTVSVLNNQARKEKTLPDLDDLIKELEAEEFRLKAQDDGPKINALHGRNHKHDYKTSVPRARGEDKNSDKHCEHCDKGGHLEEECWNLHTELAPSHIREKIEARQGRERAKANYATIGKNLTRAGERKQVIG